MKQQLKDKHVYIIVDEASIDGPLLNITIGSLDDDDLVPYCLISKLNSSPSGLVIANELKNALLKIWDDENGLLDHEEQFLVFMSDGATYMTTAFDLLVSFGFKHLKHPICLVHGLNLVIDLICNQHKNLYKFSTMVQATLCHSEQRKKLFRESSNIGYEQSLIDCLFKQCDQSASEDDIEKGDLVDILNNPIDGQWTKLLTGKYTQFVTLY